jgi:hypothetical protein
LTFTVRAATECVVVGVEVVGAVVVVVVVDLLALLHDAVTNKANVINDKIIK